MLAVVDTNVPVAANRRAPQASMQCVLNCIRRLKELIRGGRLALDDRWLILRECQAHLRSEGQPGVGDAFLRWTLTNLRNPERCVAVPIVPRSGDPENFQSFPDDERLSRFDPQDRKFVAVALAHPQRPPVLEALDSRWWLLRSVLEEHGVNVQFLCPDDIRRLAKRKIDH